MTIYLLTYSRRELCIVDTYIVQKDQSYNKNHWQVLFSCPGCDKVLSAEVQAKPLLSHHVMQESLTTVNARAQAQTLMSQAPARFV